MSRLGVDSRLLAGLSLAGVLIAPAAGAGARLEVTGSLRSAGASVEVEVTLRNAGDRPAERVTIEGELAGAADTARLDDVPVSGERHAVLRFPAAVSRPGVHAVALTVEFAESGDSPVTSQRACLLVELGAAAAPVLRLAVPAARIGSAGSLEVDLESADGAPHRARLRILAPRDLRVDDPDREIDVPPSGAVRVRLRAFRCSVPWGATRDVVAVAAAGDGDLERTSVARATVVVHGAPGWLPGWHRYLAAAAGALLVAAIVVDVWRHRSSGDEPSSPPA